MKQSTMEAYAEVDSILGLMDSKYILEIPKQLRELFKSKKDINYNKKILSNKPLQDKSSFFILLYKLLIILFIALLHLNYWCKDDQKKKELAQLYYDNEIKQEQELREKYNPDNIFKNKRTENFDMPENNKEVAMTVVEEKGLLSKILNFIRNIFKK